MKPLHCLCAALVSLLLTGCVSFTPAGPLGDPAHKAASPLQHAAMIEAVQVTDSSLNDSRRQELGKQLSAQLNRYVERGEYFQQVISFPAKVGEQDVVLKFNFSSLKGKRTPHPGYFPGALLTLTMWIWVNGPIYVDKYDLVGELTIEDTHGKQLVSTRKEQKLNQNTGLWDDDYFNLSLGAVQLRQLVDQLLEDGTQQLAQQEGRV
ncbi:hypothetical protein JQX08_17340 [Pseudomonas sp. UL073]|uniref:Lipoprotein n=1 Tax=Zestomonas insulae TaxID=2809017 RepID=A0ABS2IHD9_9GAMM|nr:hypothetical protein [Pseudomonas insulae]MBM7062481.1 hypothetical protein [Pseudomonas insulae]